MKAQTEEINNREKKEIEYVEVLGDTVYGRHMLITVIVSGSLGLGGFLIGKRIFPKISPENMVDSYSLLLGIAGLVMALVVNSLLFKPKRKLLEEESTGDKISELFEESGLSITEERESIRNNPIILKEMKELEVYNMFFPDREDENH